MRRAGGFTLLELLISMAILGFVLAGITQTFTGALTQYRQQTRIAETNIEGIIGLGLFKRDIENAGYGLPWKPDVMPSYSEATGGAVYNDAPTGPPKAFAVGNNVGWQPNPYKSDELVVRATNVARNDAAEKWTYIDSDNEPKVWGNAAEDLEGTDHVIIITPGASDGTGRTLVTSSTGTDQWRTTYNGRSTYVPGGTGFYNFVYGITASETLATLRMPFNRADYYLPDPTTLSTLPPRCAPNTTTLQKAVISQSNGSRSDTLSLLDCVANMQVIFVLDRDGDGIASDLAETLTDPLGTALSAEQIRDQVKEVRVYILAHEGQKDTSYTHPVSTITVGESGLGADVGVSAYLNYRWKLYILAVKPMNLL
jgi:prepilin-type N-terminal cleavage/methylation domain-containing protein